ncbi:MAG: ArnT family glycosyltransferase [Planctomycetota bacterium]
MLLRNEWCFLSAILVGFYLRSYLVMDQILVGDEWHSLHNVIQHDFLEIYKGFGTTDYCIPITLYYELASHTIGLSDWVIRIPPFVFGMLGVILIPIIIRVFFGRMMGSITAWFVATSPLLIYFSRFGRPYIFTFFFSVMGLFSLAAWWETKQRRHAASYAACTILGGFFHVVVLPYLFAPFLFFLAKIPGLPRAEGRKTLRRLFLLIFTAAVPLALLLALPVLHDGEALLKKAWLQVPTGESVLETARIFSGTGELWQVVCLFLIALAGFCFLYRQAPLIMNIMVVASIIQCIALVVVQPGRIDDSLALCRYLLPVLLLYLVCISGGIIGLIRLVETKMAERISPEAAAPFLGIGICVLMLLLGPVPSALSNKNNWFANNMTIDFSSKGDLFKASVYRVSGFYTNLGWMPPYSVKIVEYPIYLHICANPLPLYQRIHGQETFIGFAGDLAPSRNYWCWGTVPRDFEGIHLSHFVYLSDLSGMEEEDIDYVVLHKNLIAEFDLAEKHDSFHLLEDNPPDLSSCTDFYRHHVGEAVFEDQDLIVFHLGSKPAE